jgi:Helix-turn-helix domain of resolvase
MPFVVRGYCGHREEVHRLWPIGANIGWDTSSSYPQHFIGKHAYYYAQVVGPGRRRAVTSIVATIAELELELGKERRAASREARITRGLPATKPMKLDAAQQKRLLRLYRQGEPVGELITIFGISRSTMFRTLKVLTQREPE